VSRLASWYASLTAEWPIKYQLNGGQTRIMPVHVLDVAEALNVMLTAPVTSTASTFVLPGPEAYTFTELLNLVEFFTMRKMPNFPTVPRPVIEFVAKVLDKAVWWPTITPDEVIRKYMDDRGVAAHLFRPDPSTPAGWGVETAEKPFVGVDGEPVKGFADLDISPDLIEEHAMKYLRRYRTA
jgi:NADH dehydrogenase (ubiquinone) 1 alpha subcomplex subunit 9